MEWKKEDVWLDRVFWILERASLTSHEERLSCQDVLLTLLMQEEEGGGARYVPVMKREGAFCWILIVWGLEIIGFLKSGISAIFFIQV